jgi:hypothetical protein
MEEAKAAAKQGMEVLEVRAKEAAEVPEESAVQTAAQLASEQAATRAPSALSLTKPENPAMTVCTAPSTKRVRTESVKVERR